MARMKAAMAAVLVMEKEGVTQAFGVPGDEGWFRLSVGAASEAEIKAALPRLAAAMRALHA